MNSLLMIHFLRLLSQYPVMRVNLLPTLPSHGAALKISLLPQGRKILHGKSTEHLCQRIYLRES